MVAVLLRKLKDAAGDADIKVPLKAVRSAIEQSYQQDRCEPSAEPSPCPILGDLPVLAFLLCSRHLPVPVSGELLFAYPHRPPFCREN